MSDKIKSLAERAMVFVNLGKRSQFHKWIRYNGVYVLDYIAARIQEIIDQVDKKVFTTDEVNNLNDYQHSGIFHPFTCGMDQCRATLVATVRGWICPFCDYTQDWAHDFMKNFDKSKAPTISNIVDMTKNTEDS